MSETEKYNNILAVILITWFIVIITVVVLMVDFNRKQSQEHQEVMQRLDTLEQWQTYLIDLLNK